MNEPRTPETTGAPVAAPRSLGGHAVSGFAWSGLGYGSQALGQILVLAVLARYVSADDFGVISATLLVIGIGKLFTQSVVGPAVVQRPQLERRHRVTAFWLAVVSGLAVAVATVLMAPVVERFFRFENLEPVLLVLSFSFVLQAPAVLSEALMQRELDFRRLAMADAVSFFVGYCAVGVILAVAGAGVWALVGANLAQVAVHSALLLTLRRPEVSAEFDRAAAGEILHFGGGFTAGKVFNYAAGQGDYFVIGRWMTASDLGYYSRAYQLVAMPAMLLGQMMDRVLFPVMASFQHDRARLAEAYRRGISLVATVMAPLSVLIVMLAPEIVRVLLGPDWGPVVAPLRVLALGLVCRTGYKISDSLARSVGTVYKRAWRQAIYAALVVTGALVGRRWGITGVAWGVLFAIVVNYAAMAALSLASTGMSWTRFLTAHVRGLALAAATAVATYVCTAALRSAGAGALVVLVGAGGAVAVGLLTAARFAPELVLGPDALWVIKRIKDKAT
ncbi:MAG TPA: lipopolysaccharide biosynthesis protein [Acidimicrobiales bacterium]|nr:lipopolysaccharide biosynthesis protein [Acidimicrobiales bacterium]